MASKNEISKFNANVLAFAISRGAQTVSERRLKMQTSIGELHISVHEPEKSEVFSVYCQFPNIDKMDALAITGLNINPYSGKMNFHGFTDRALNGFKETIDKIAHNVTTTD